MQNFTLRFKGKMFYLLTLTLLIGSLSSMYGQACPTVDDASQSFCNALSTVADLKPSGVDWYDEPGSTDPLPMNEILRNGEDYYAGAPGCTGTRESVTVTITGPSTPVVNDDFFTPCADGTYTIADLKEAIDADPAPSGYTLEIFSSRYDKDAMPLADTDPLSTGNYFAGYYDSDTNCQSKRKPVRYEPVVANAPAAASPQTVCEGTTVSELEAEGTNLWYRTATSEPALPDDYEVEDGETYYASRVVPADGPPCESDERTPVMVNVTPADAGPDSTDNVLCVSEADSQLNTISNARNYFLSLLNDDVPTGGDFDMSTLSEIVTDYNDGTSTGNYQTTYTVSFGGGCEDSVVLGVTVQEDPYAGEDTSKTICVSEIESFLPYDPSYRDAAKATIISYINSITEVDVYGSFLPGINKLFNQINTDYENNAFPKTYKTIYTVNNGGCKNSATLTLTIQSTNDAGESNSETMCKNDVDDEGIFTSEASLKAYYIDLLGAEDTDGSFSPALATLISNYNDGIDGSSEDFSTTYTVNSSSECDPDMATATLTVNAVKSPEAGTGSNETYCSNDTDDINLTTLLSGDYDMGTFSSPDADVADGTFNPSEEGAGSYDITYTVSPDTDCVSGTASTSFTITVNQAPNAGPGGDFSFCQGEFQEILANPITAGQKLLNELGGDDIDLDGKFSDDTLSELIIAYGSTSTFPATFETTYTVMNGDCTDSAMYSITITPNTEVNAGGDQTDTFCESDGPQNLMESLGDGATSGGMFSSDDADVADGMFDPSTEGAGTYTVTYTVNGDDDPCMVGESSAKITITVDESVTAGEPNSETLCTDEIADDFFTEANLSDYFMGLLSDGADAGGFFEPSIADLVNDYEGGMTTGTFITTYTVTNGTCSSSAKLSLTIRENVTADLTEVDPQTICQNAGVQDLRDFLGDNPDFGTFTYDGNTIEDAMFNPGEMGPGTYEITYTLDEDTTPCVTGSDSITITVTVEESAYAGGDMKFDVCQSAGVQDLFGMLSDATDTTGRFMYDGDVIEDGMMDPAAFAPGTYTVTYMVDPMNDCGADSAEFMITVIESPEAGTIDPVEVCQNADPVDLFGLLSDDADMDGTFSVNDETITDGMMNPGAFDPGTYSVTYTVMNEDCTDTATFDITVQESAFAGDIMDFEVCMNADTVDLFSHLADDADTDGDFMYDGSVIEDGIMNPGDFEAGTYTITYMVKGMNDCGDDMTTFDVTVVEAPEAGGPVVAEVCMNDDVVDLFSLLGDDASTSGMFTLDGETITDGMMNPADFEPGEYKITYTVSTGDKECTDTAMFTITVLDMANAGESMPPIDVCMNAGVQDLFSFLSADADTNGEFTLNGEPIADGMMDPSTFEAGTYTVTYKVDEINKCGPDSVDFTINVLEAPNAPEIASEISYCAIQAPTGADLMMEGDDLTFYIDAELQNMVTADMELTEGTYYVTQQVDGGCESNAASFEVVINDPGTPTIEDANLTFCQYDDATVADLSEAVDQTSNVTWYTSEDGMEALNTATTLQSGSYYASLYDPETDCESSQRLKVTVTIEDCPLVFPEGISPNGDGKNDKFVIENIEREYPNYSIEIYNRWGDVVYKGDANTPEWDGTTNQSGSFGSGVLPVGVYFYLLDFNDGVTAPKKGKIYLSR